MVAITAGLPIFIVAHSSLVMMWRLSQINTGTLYLVCIIVAVRSWPLGLVTNVLLPLLKCWTQHLTGKICGILIIHASQILWILIGMEPSGIRNPFTTLCLVCTSTTSTILHCCCVERMWQTGAMKIMVELDSAAIWWRGQEIVPGAVHVYVCVCGGGGGAGLTPCTSTPPPTWFLVNYAWGILTYIFIYEFN
jgi:hypothetical protein